MSSSEAWADDGAAPAPAGQRGASSYTRFIPREELGHFAAWTPALIGEPLVVPDANFTEFTTPQRRNTDPGYRPDDPQSAAAAQTAAQTTAPQAGPGAATSGSPPAGRDNGQFEPGLGLAGQAAAGGRAGPAHPAAQRPGPAAEAAPGQDGSAAAWRESVRAELQQELLGEWQEAAEAELDAQVQTARQTGYQDGYRDGLVALDSFKQSYAQQVTGQVSQLLLGFDQELQALERQLADGVVRVATELARQVVRSELSVRPALVAQVAQEAVAALLKGARHVSVTLHPDDQSLVRDGCGEALQATGAQLVASAQMARGGCKVESDMGSIDARIATRWQVAARALGSELPWVDDEAEPGADA